LTLRDMLADPRSADEMRADIERAKTDETPPVLFPTATFIGRNQDGQPVFERPNGNRVIKRPDGTALAEAPNMLSGPGFGPYQRPQHFQTAEEVEAPPRGSREAPVELVTPGDVHAGAEQTAQPTPAQAEAGNYAKRHLKWNGLDIAIETEAGGQRTGISKDGTPWSTTLKHPYGYIKRTVGKDGDQIDLYLGPDPLAKSVFVFDQIDPDTQKFDEHKAVIGARSLEEAVAIYDAGFSDGSAMHRRGGVAEMSPAEFKTWLAEGDTRKALAYRPQRAAPKRKGPLSLFEFLAQNGGIKDHGGELRSMDLHKLFVPGFGRLVRANGRDLDKAREAAVEAGYLSDAGWNNPNVEATTTIRDLLDAISEEARGRKVFSQRDLAQAQQRADERAAEESAEREKEAREEIAEAAKREDIPLTPEELREAAQYRLVTGADPIDAIAEIVERDHYAEHDEAVSYEEPQESSNDAKAANDARAADLGSTRQSPPRQQPTGPAVGAPREAAPQREQPGQAQRSGSEAGEPAAADRGTERVAKDERVDLKVNTAPPVQLPATEMFLQIGNRRYPITDYKEASDKVLAAGDELMRQGHGPTSGGFSSPLIVDSNGKTIGYVSWNGRVWPGAPRDWTSEREPLYDNQDNRPPLTATELLQTPMDRETFAAALDDRNRSAIGPDGASYVLQPMVGGTTLPMRYAGKGREDLRDLAAKTREAAKEKLLRHLYGTVPPAQTAPKIEDKTTKAPAKPGPSDSRASDVKRPGQFNQNVKAKNTKSAPALELRGTDQIEDFGEKIEGARKDTFAGFRDSLGENVDIVSAPLSKSFPQPNYEKLAEGGVSKRVLAHIAIMRDMIPNRPRVAWKAKRWATQVETLRSFARQLLDGSIDVKRFEQAARDNRLLDKLPLTAQAIEDVAPADLPRAARYRVDSGSYSMLNGQRFSPNKSFWFMVSPEGRTQRNPLSNDPANPYTYRETPAEAVALAKQIIASELKQQPTAGTGERSKYTETGIYQDRASKQFFIGFKVRSTVIRLKAGFEDFKKAREYQQENRDELQATIDAMREGPNMRGTENRPRSGEALREGDVSPEAFSSTFGFRGVQFGNYVEGPRRQADLNRAFDALMDLADVIGVPPRALSLNGELGLAFGARGQGGKRAFAAHYEPGQVVINLTKGSGPGSLAHEWLHAVDNYFARQEVGKPKSSVFISQYQREAAGAVRDEVYQAWKNVEATLSKGSFADRSAKFDESRSKPYWGTTIEKAARAFERYIVDRLAEKGAANDYLANIDLAGGAYPTTQEMAGGIRAAFDRLFDTIETKDTDAGVAMFALRPDSGARQRGIPAAASEPIATFRNDRPLKAHADYRAAKAGDDAAAQRLVAALVKPENIAAARQRFGADVIYVPVLSEELTGHNSIPVTLAEFYAAEAGDDVTTNMMQTARAYHTGASAIERVASRAQFTGQVERGRRYVLVDDVSVMGSTLADLADHIQRGGGEVVGAVVLVNAGRLGVLSPKPRAIREIERRFGDVIRDELDLDPQALTGDEAAYLLNFRDADALRTTIATGARRRDERLRAKGVQKEDVASSPKQPEKVIGAAVRVQGRVFTGVLHSDAWEAAEREIGDLATADKNPNGEGFITSEGRFVGRSEAGRLAADAGQLVNPMTGRKEREQLPEPDLHADALEGWREEDTEKNFQAVDRATRAGDRRPQERLTVNGRAAWAMVMDERDFSVLHTVRFAKAEDSDFHHNHYLPANLVEKIRAGEARVVWGDAEGVHSMEPMSPQMRAAAERYLYRDDGRAALRAREGEEAPSGARIDTPFTGKFAAHAAAIEPIIRGEMDRLGLKHVALRLADQIRLYKDGKTGLADGLYLRNVLTLALEGDAKFKILHHEALHALRRAGLFTEGEWAILERASNARWRKQFDIDNKYAQWPEWVKVEEGIAHAYAESVDGRPVGDGRIVRLFKRIQRFFEALRNALHGEGFKTVESIFRDIETGVIGQRTDEALPSRDIPIGQAQPEAAAIASQTFMEQVVVGVPTGQRAMTAEEITRAIGSERLNHVKQALRQLVEEGRVEREGTSANYRYRQSQVAYAIRSGDGDFFKTEIVETPDGPRQQGIIPGAERISERERLQRRADAPLKPKREQKPADEGLFGDEKDQGALFALREDPATAAQRQTVMQGFLARGQYLDRALRMPFDFFGGVTRDGTWKPGAKLYNTASNIIINASFSPQGRFAFLNPILETARTGLIDRYNLRNLPEYVERERARSLDERAVMVQGAGVLKSLKEHNVGPAEARVLVLAKVVVISWSATAADREATCSRL
jgi:hypothetical protein